jgi:hypothetical protein
VERQRQHPEKHESSGTELKFGRKSSEPQTQPSYLILQLKVQYHATVIRTAF